jgi:hypothetical protein
MHRPIIAAVAALVLPVLPATARPPSAVMPAAFRGTWESDIARCADADSESRLRIGPREVMFYEHGGTPTRVGRLDRRTIRVTASTSDDMGERGVQTWTFRLSGNGADLTEIGPGESGQPMHRCPRE